MGREKKNKSKKQKNQSERQKLKNKKRRQKQSLLSFLNISLPVFLHFLSLTKPDVQMTSADIIFFINTVKNHIQFTVVL